MKGGIVMKNEMSRRQFLGFAGSAAAVLGLGLVGCGGSAGSGVMGRASCRVRGEISVGAGLLKKKLK